MICKPCQIAGDMIAEARGLDFGYDENIHILDATNSHIDSVPVAPTVKAVAVPVAPTVKAVANLYHGVCKGRSHCDCAHVVDLAGKAIQQ